KARDDNAKAFQQAKTEAERKKVLASIRWPQTIAPPWPPGRRATRSTPRGGPHRASGRLRHVHGRVHDAGPRGRRGATEEPGLTSDVLRWREWVARDEKRDPGTGVHRTDTTSLLPSGEHTLVLSEDESCDAPCWRLSSVLSRSAGQIGRAHV